MRLGLSTAMLALCLAAPGAYADEYRYTGTVVRVIDGDPLIVDVPEWPALFRPARVRVSNAPESRRGQAK
jgi:endonuclease YncB( thermonuclease family)